MKIGAKHCWVEYLSLGILIAITKSSLNTEGIKLSMLQLFIVKLPKFERRIAHLIGECWTWDFRDARLSLTVGTVLHPWASH